jgi:DNA-binding transcriptional ArsR family regulator
VHVFAALGNATRLALVRKLSGGEPRLIAQLRKGSKMTRQAVTKHLRVLEAAGIVRSARKGRRSVFEFEPRTLEGVSEYLDSVSKQWDRALERLKAFVEK